MITSTSNAQVKNLVQLKKKAKARNQQQVYVVEGIRMFREAPDDRITQIYVSESFLRDLENQKALEGKTYEVLSDTVFSYVSDTKTPQGILCLVKMADYTLDDVLSKKSGVWLVLENVQDPGNLGTMFRTGEGAGIAGVIMDGSTVDIYNPKTIRSTMGSIYRVPFFVTKQLPETILALKQRGIHTFAAHLAGSVCYDEPDYCQPCAFLIGNEGNGLTDEISALADTYIRIPMGGQLESLNAAMAAGILRYEANRQRRKK
jgi:TrmH family RNA methyltransferase